MKEWIITSSILLLVLILLRAIFRKQISAKLQFALWGFALIRLLLPFSFSNSPISIMNFVQAEPPSVSAPMLPSQQYPSESTTAATPVIFFAQGNDASHSEISAQPQTEVSATLDSPTTGSIRDILFYVWTTGSVILALCLFASNLRFYLLLRRDRTALQLDQPLPVYLSTVITSPCLFGRSIYITPNATETQDRLNHVLTHELCHWQQHDHLWSLLRGLCLAIWWWNPLVWVAAFLSRRDCEAACDERAVIQLGEEHRLDYGKTLVDMIAVMKPRPSLLCTATTMTGKDMRERLQRIVHRKKIQMPVVAIVLVLSLICVGCTFTGADKPEAQITDSTGSETLVFQSIEDDVLVCLDGSETVYVYPNGLLSDATLRALEQGDVLNVQYTSRDGNQISATDISVDPISGSISNVDPVVPTPPEAEDPSADMPTETPTETPAEPTPPTTEPDPPTEDTLVSPDDSETILASLEAFFNPSEHGVYRRQVFTHFYSDPTEANLCSLFYNGTVTSDRMNFDSLSAPEQEALRKTANHNEYREWCDIDRMTAEQMDIALQHYFGISLADTNMNGLNNFEYLPEFGYFYLFHTDTNALAPIKILDVTVDSNGFYYMTYRLAELPNAAPSICCLQWVDGSWKVLANMEEGTPIDPTAALEAIDSHQAKRYTVIRPGISASLEYAISSALLDYARAQMPKYADFVTEAHDVLYLEWKNDLLYVNTVTCSKNFYDGDGNIESLDAVAKCVTLVFYVTESGNQLCYQLEEIIPYEDPSDPDGIFSGKDWAMAAGLTLEDILPALESQCDAQVSSVPSLDPAYSDAFLAAMSGEEAEEAAQNVVDYLGKQRHILRYQSLGAERRQRDTNILIDELKGSDIAAFYGWDDEYIEKNVAVVLVACSVEYNPHFGDELASGVYQQEFFVCRDPETWLWRVYSMGEQIKLVDYSTNN